MIRRGLIGARGGNVAEAFSLLAPALLAGVGVGVDFARMSAFRAELQEIADSAALVGARQFLLAANDQSTPVSVAKATLQSKLADRNLLGEARIEAEADPEQASVVAQISFDYRPTFVLSLIENPIPINVTSMAQAKGGMNVCVIGTDTHASRTVNLQENARLTGAECGVFSNAGSTRGLAAVDSSKIEAALICTSGGYEGGELNFSMRPLEDCPPREDPLSEREGPQVGSCDHQDFIAPAETTLHPGVYCGGLKVGAGSSVRLSSGVYIIDEGELRISGDARIEGEGVGFYFTGGSRMTIGDDADVDLTAPTDGPLAGMLFFEDRDEAGARVFRITSPNARRLVGTIYLPNGRFLADADGAVAEESEYTLIVARRVELGGDVNLVLNADYELTTVPVPSGLGQVGGEVVLRE